MSSDHEGGAGRSAYGGEPVVHVDHLEVGPEGRGITLGGERQPPAPALPFQVGKTREIGDRREEGNSLGNRGLAYRDLGEVRRAIEHHEQALVIAQEVRDRPMGGAALGDLGSACYRLGEVRQALEHHAQALVIDREIGNRRGEGSTLANQGIAYHVLGEIQRAIAFFEQALVILEAIESPYAATARENLTRARQQAHATQGPDALPG